MVQGETFPFPPRKVVAMGFLGSVRLWTSRLHVHIHWESIICCFFSLHVHTMQTETGAIIMCVTHFIPFPKRKCFSGWRCIILAAVALISPLFAYEFSSIPDHPWPTPPSIFQPGLHLMISDGLFDNSKRSQYNEGFQR